MSGQDPEAVEQPRPGRVRLCEHELDRMRAQLADLDRASADDQEIPPGCRDLLVEIDPEAEQDVVGIERLAVGEAQPAAQLEAVAAAVVRDRPGPGERRLHLLRATIDVQQVGHGPLQQLPGRSVDDEHRVQGARLGAQGGHQAAAVAPGAFDHQGVSRRSWCRAGRERGQQAERRQRDPWPSSMSMESHLYLNNPANR